MPQLSEALEDHGSMVDDVDRAFSAIRSEFSGDRYREALLKRKVIHFPGLVKDVLAGFPGLSDVEQALEQRALRSTDLRVFAGRESLDLERLRIVNGSKIEPQMLANTALLGNTMVFNNLQKSVFKAHRFIRQMEAWLGDPMEIGVIASFGSASGLTLHNDREHLLIVQLDGEKNWSFYEPLVPPGTVVEPEPKGAPNRQLTLLPGDVLLLPAGQLHFCDPDGFSVHNVIGLRASCGFYMMEKLKAALDDCVALMEPAPAILGPENDSKVAAHCRAHLHELIDQFEIEKFFVEDRKKRRIRERIKLLPRKG